jgi:hypothetical protein
MALVKKQRNGAKVTKRYDQAKTPYQHILDRPDVPEAAKSRLRQHYQTLNPAELLRQIFARQDALWKLAIRPSNAQMA